MIVSFLSTRQIKGSNDEILSSAAVIYAQMKHLITNAVRSYNFYEVYTVFRLQKRIQLDPLCSKIGYHRTYSSKLLAIRCHELFK